MPRPGPRVELLPELAGCDIEEPAVVEVEPDVFVSAGDGAAAAEVWRAIHDQIQSSARRGSLCRVGRQTPRSHTQFQIHESEPVGSDECRAGQDDAHVDVVLTGAWKRSPMRRWQLTS